VPLDEVFMNGGDDLDDAERAELPESIQESVLATDIHCLLPSAEPV
jgi:hypothetical protein